MSLKKYRMFFGKSGQNILTFLPKAYVSVDRPLIQKAKNRKDDEPKSALLPKLVRPYRAVAIASHTVIIEEGCVLSTESIYRVVSA